jgi:hypothetical protein
MFNRLRFFERVASGELTEVVIEHRERTPRWSQDPLYRQMVRYFDGDEQVAVVNQWLRFDGTLSASGRPDPKRIVVDGKTYWTDEEDDA